MPHYPPPDNPQVCLVRLIFKRDTREMLNTFHVSKASAWTSGQMTILANDILSWYTTFYRGVIPNDITLVQIQVRKQDPLDPQAVDLAVTSGGTGTRGGPTEAGNVSVTMSERTGLAGRAYRGRMYVPGIIEGDVTADDRIGSSLIAGLTAAISNLITDLVSAGFALTVFHRPGLTPHIRDNTFNNVLFYVIENIIDSQRRRLPNRGR